MRDPHKRNNIIIDLSQRNHLQLGVYSTIMFFDIQDTDSFVPIPFTIFLKQCIIQSKISENDMIFKSISFDQI
jgi:hypothetical protein